MRLAVSGRTVSLALLLALALLVLRSPLSAHGTVGAQATFCLGFILLFGYYAARALERVHLPSITGYILTGVLCGPYVLNLLSPGVVADLQALDDVALAVIALIAGGEMRLSVIRRRGAAIAAVIGGQTVASMIAAPVVVWALGAHLGGLPAGGWRPVAAVGLLFGLITVARSPSTTIGVITESRARGPVTEMLVGVTVLLDVVVLVLAAFVVPAAEALLGGDGGGGAFVKTVVVEVAGSVGVGLILAGLLGTYIRWIGGFLPVFLLGLGLIGSGICRAYHLEPLLAFMVAGFVVENFSVHGERMIEGLERSAFPVYVVFFAISGAAIDLRALADTWVLALVLVAARAAAFLGGEWAASGVVGGIRAGWGGSWSGFLAQAGVTLGIAAMIERRFAWGASFRAIVLAVVAVNQLVGPIALRWLLERAGEVGRMDARRAPGRPTPGPDA